MWCAIAEARRKMVTVRTASLAASTARHQLPDLIVAMDLAVEAVAIFNADLRMR